MILNKTSLLQGRHFFIEKYWCPIKLFFEGKKEGLVSDWEASPLCYFCCSTKSKTTWAKVHILADSRSMAR